jgi:lipopolysaccharide transport system permease protein
MMVALMTPLSKFRKDSRIGNNSFRKQWLNDLLSSRFSAYCLFKRQLAQQYRYSSLGLFWAFVPTILTAVVLIGSQRAQMLIASSVVPAAFYGIFGVALAQTFLEGVNSTRRLFISHQHLMRRQALPLDAFIMADVMQMLFTMLVRLSIVVAVYAIFSVATPSPLMAMLAVVGYCGIAFAGSGLGLLIAPFTALTQDFEHVSSLLPWTIFAITPVFVPITGSTILGHIAAINPLTWVFDGIRAAAYGGEGQAMSAALAGLLGTLLLLLGWSFCRVARPHVVERLMM